MGKMHSVSNGDRPWCREQSRKKENIKRIHLNNEVGNKELISETNKITNIFTHKDSLQQKEGIETTVGMIDIV